MAQAKAEAGYFKVAGGDELYFEDSGGNGPVLFYIYGLGCSIKHWKYPMAHFARGPYRQVWFDFRGHGASPPLSSGERLTVDTVVSDIKALCRHLGIASAAFLGQSMGGCIALALAHAEPSLVESLVLLTTPGRDPARFLPLQPLSRWLWRAVTTLNQKSPLAVRLLCSPAAAGRLHPVLRLPLREVVRNSGFNPRLARTEDIDEYVLKILAVDPNLFCDLALELRDFDVARFTPPISCRTLVIAGGADRIVPLAETERLAAHLPKAQLAVIPHGSHCPHFDDPRVVIEHIAAFLAE